jgi:predicted amidohydrolase
MKFSLILGIFGAWLSALVSTDETSSTSDSQLGNRVLVASVSFEPVKLDLVGNANLLEELFRRAAAGGAKIAVAPEGALDGYIVNEIISGQIPPERMKEVAIPLDSPEIGRFQNLARELEICMAFGFAELVRDSETQVEDVYNTAVLLTLKDELVEPTEKCYLLRAMTLAGGLIGWELRAEPSTLPMDGVAS